MDLPYKCEYAKSSRASCRGCKLKIEGATLRLAVMVQSPMFDGKSPNWYHYECFFKKQRPKTVDDFENYDTIRYEDQQRIKEEIESLGAVIVPAKKGKKRGADKGASSSKALQDFHIEYSKSSRATCVGCENKIMKDEVRISKKDFESEIGKKYGGQDRWHHLTCFAQLRSTVGYFAGADMLPGFKTLSKDDQAEAKKQLPAIKQEEVVDAPDIKKVKKEDDNEELIKEQNKLFYDYRDKLAQLSKDNLQTLLMENKQEVPAGKDRILDRVADIMTFGRLLPCEECNGQFVLKTGGYLCTGHATEWSKCQRMIKDPKRAKFKVPSSLMEHDFLKKYKYVPRTRYIKDVTPSAVKKEKDDPDGAGPRVKREAPPLLDMQFVILGKPPRGRADLKKRITKLGGKVTTKINKDVMAVIASQQDVDKMGARMEEARDAEIHVVTEEFLDEVANSTVRVPELIKEKAICDWGGDPYKRLPPEPSVSKSRSASIYTKSVPKKITMKLKSGGVVDPDSGLEDTAVIYTEGNAKYNALLGLTEIQTKRNSYYKLQLLRSEKGKDKFWLFRSWGRIGTTIGGTKLDVMATLHEAKAEFERLYEEKSGNMWCDRDDFQKVPGKMYPIDLDHGEDDAGMEMNEDIPSNLPKPVQNLVKMIFDVKAMKNTMMAFELDTEKMPLGKLSKKQIENAFSVLKEIQTLITNKAERQKFIDASNRFYTFVPHSFGVDDAPIIETEDVIKQKSDMLNNLLELEIAYNIMKTSGKNTGIDEHYSKLNAEITVVDEGSKEYDIVKQYVKNTHAETHDMYELELAHLFAVKRQGEEKRYKPFKKLPNKKLLWHGSRLTNYAGILSQGLRIAPPEAPVTGYMFGKGVYFADMVSKSANYCCTDSVNSTGLMLLCEVALGNMHECKSASYIEKLPKNKHSCKGVGMTHPDPEHVEMIGDAEVPLGKAVQNKSLKSALLYNEYIVYDVAQVNVKYLCQMNFKYKY